MRRLLQLPCRLPKEMFELRAIFYAFFVVKFYHEEHKGYTKDTRGTVCFPSPSAAAVSVIDIVNTIPISEEQTCRQRGRKSLNRSCGTAARKKPSVLSAKQCGFSAGRNQFAAFSFPVYRLSTLCYEVSRPNYLSGKQRIRLGRIDAADAPVHARLL